MQATQSVVFHSLPYQPDALTERFTPLSALPWAMLLHSGAAQHQHNRFDILVADPLITLTTRGGLTQIEKNGVEQCRQDDPFALLEEQLTACGLHAESLPEFPFLGGALGLFGYDLGRRVEDLPQIAKAILSCPIWLSGFMTGR